MVGALAFLYPSAIPMVDYEVQDSGSGPSLVRWRAALGPPPTRAALVATEQTAAFLDWQSRDRAPERSTLRRAASQAMADLDQFLALAPPSNAQTLQAVRTLAQQQRAIIARLVQVE